MRQKEEEGNNSLREHNKWQAVIRQLFCKRKDGRAPTQCSVRLTETWFFCGRFILENLIGHPIHFGMTKTKILDTKTTRTLNFWVFLTHRRAENFLFIGESAKETSKMS